MIDCSAQDPAAPHVALRVQPLQGPAETPEAARKEAGAIYCARCFSLRNHGRVKNPEAERNMPCEGLPACSHNPTLGERSCPPPLPRWRSIRSGPGRGRQPRGTGARAEDRPGGRRGLCRL